MDFNRHAGNISAKEHLTFGALEAHVCGFVTARIDSVLNDLSQNPLHPHFLLLSQMRDAVANTYLPHNTGTRVFFESEAVLSTSINDARYGFEEGLMRVFDHRNTLLSPAKIFSLLNHYPDLGGTFRTWLALANIQQFYSAQPASAALSINLVPQDIDDENLRATLEHALDLAREQGYRNIILEAVETAPWSDEGIAFLRAYQAKGGRIAIDDYGAADGYHDTHMLRAFPCNGVHGALIVKLDGKMITDFLNGTCTALPGHIKDIQTHAPHALILAEWINPRELPRLRAGLASHGLDQAIHLIQDKDIERPLHLRKKQEAPANMPQIGLN